MASKTERAIAMWNEAGRIAGTPAEAYLTRRGIMPAGDVSDSLRYYEDFDERILVGAIRCWRNGTPGETVAIQRIYLNADGTKAGESVKMSLGTMSDASGNQAFWMMQGSEETVICEGVEDALAVRMAFYARAQRPPTVVATLGIGRFKRAAEFFQGAVFMPDNEPDAIAKAHAAAHACRGKVAIIDSVKDCAGQKDANALLQAVGSDALLAVILQPVSPVPPTPAPEASVEKESISSRALKAPTGRPHADSKESRPEDVVRALAGYWDPDSFEDWTKSALALHGFNGGKQMWLAWAKHSTKFNAAENERKWKDTVPNKGITVASILARVPKSVLSDWGQEHVDANSGDHLRGFDKEPSGDNGDNGDSVPKRRLEVLSLIDLMDDESPDEPNYVEPDFLGPGGFCLIAGPPKAQKSFLLTELLLTCATGGKFLDGLFSVPRPLKVFYLQAEMGRRLLKKRAKMAAMISSEERRLIAENFAVTSRVIMRLDDNGVREVVAAIKARFPDGGPDIIAIDPLANLFDGESEDKAPEVMKFLTHRVEAIRQRVNPAAAVVMVHHSGKRTSDMMAADPFSSIRGSGALRGYYDTGVVIYRRSEESPDRRIHFELREGESPEPVTARLSRYGTFEVIDTSLGAISRSMAKEMLEEVDRRWKDKKPLAKSHVAGDRHAARYLARKFEVSAEAVKKLVEAWLDNDIVEDCELPGRSTRRGLKKVANID